MGIGMILAAVIIAVFSSALMSDRAIEERARKLGMVYPDEVRVFEESFTENGGEGRQ
jgi:cell division protein FtsB